MSTDKKFKKVVTNPETGREKTVRYGAKGYSISPGTKRGDSYCARSMGQMRQHPEAAKDPNSPLRLSRKKWKCVGEKSQSKAHGGIVKSKMEMIKELVKRKMAKGGMVFKELDEMMGDEDTGFLDNKMQSPFVEHEDEPIESEEQLKKKTLAHVFERMRQKHGR